MVTTLLVGNPKANSRTLEAGLLLVGELTDADPDRIVDVATLGCEILEDGKNASAALEAISSADVLVVGSPTFKATYSGVLKVLLDSLPTQALADVTALPFMLGASPRHALACELTLKPVLVELGATCPMSGLFIDQDNYEALALESRPWIDRARRFTFTNWSHHVQTAR